MNASHTSIMYLLDVTTILAGSYKKPMLFQFTLFLI